MHKLFLCGPRQPDFLFFLLSLGARMDIPKKAGKDVTALLTDSGNLYFVSFSNVLQVKPDILPFHSHMCLITDMVQLQKREDLSDVTLTCEATDGHMVVKAHKNILCARSSKFHAMFGSTMKEGQTNKVTLKLNADLHTVRDLMNYIYTGQVDCRNIKELLSFLKLADEQLILSARRVVCSQVALLPDSRSSSHIEDMVDVLLVAEQLHCTELKTVCIGRIANHIDDYLVNSYFAEHILKLPVMHDILEEFRIIHQRRQPRSPIPSWSLRR